MGRTMQLAGRPTDLLRRLSDMEQPGSLSAELRRRRLVRFDAMVETLAVGERPSVLDVGGTVRFWERLDALERFDLTVLNLRPDRSAGPGARLVTADASRLPFADKSFAVAFSNSVIEHIGGAPEHRRMLAEMQRVAHAVFLQTPCRWFPIEPHFHFPFFGVLPLEVRAWLVEHLDLGHGGPVADRDEARARARSVQLLCRRDLRRYAPDLHLEYERFCAWPKCYLLSGPC
jgi:hypothetical protein